MATKRLGLIRRGINLRDDLFVPPGGAGVQLSLLWEPHGESDWR